MFTLSKRIIKLGWQSFSRDGGLVVANIFIMVMMLSVATSLFIMKDVSQFLISSIQEKVDISVYFKLDIAEEDILAFKEDVVEIPEVKQVEYISREKALEDFSQRHKDNPVLMESLEEVAINPFLASLNIKSFEASQYQSIATFLENAKFENLIEKVDYYERKPVIERIFSLTSGLNNAGIIFSVILAIVAILVVFNSIRLAIYNTKEEIKIQRLVGASNWFIRGPFLVQGIIIGLAATPICLLIFALFSWVLTPTFSALFPGLNLFTFYVANIWTIVIIQLATGITLGVISSLIAIRRYLEV